MTQTKTKEEWVNAWETQAKHFYSIYQCKADPRTFDSLDSAIKDLIWNIGNIADRMEKEGIWNGTG
jgi:hypothetical protein